MNSENDFLSVMPPASAGVTEIGIRAEKSQTSAGEAGFINQKQLLARLQPRFVRLPKPGTLCPFTGLSRTQIYLLCKSGKIKSHSLKRPGTCRGVRLIDYQSLVAAIEEFASAEEQENQKQ
jgi:hypothetical protein